MQVQTHRLYRPLPAEMLHYARADTHFLLFVFDHLRNALLDRVDGKDELMKVVLKRSEETALKVYVKEEYDANGGSGRNGWDLLLQKWGYPLTELQASVFKVVHRWRDQVARDVDESVR
jgi:exosome complex exonuclease RRP6